MSTGRARRSVMTSLLYTALACGAGACGDDRSQGDVVVADSAATTEPGDTASVVPDSVAPTTDSAAATDSAAPDEDSAAPADTHADTSKLDTAAGDDTTEPADTSAPPDVVEPVAEVRFVVMGDTGEGNDRQKKVAQAIVDQCAERGCDFVMLLGDNIYDAGVESVLDAQWQSKFEVPYQAIDLPFYAVLGNHDNGGFLSQLFGDTFAGAGAEFERGDHEVAYTTVSAKWKMPGRTYDFEAGPAHFFALDTNDMVWSEINGSAEQRMDIMLDTFPRDIDASTATWKIAFGHHPYFSNGQHGNAGSYEGLEEGIGDLIAAIPVIGDLGPTIQGKGVKDGLDTIVCGRVDLYFAGHEHNRQWFPEDTGDCAGTTFVVSGAGAKLTEFKRSQPTLFQDDQKAGFFWVHLAGKALEVEAIDEDGVRQWTHQAAKP